MLSALLFDLDGTMVDTDRLHLGAWNMILAARTRAIDLAFYKTHIMGFSAEAVTEALFPGCSPGERAGLSDAKEQAFRSMVGRLEPILGLPAFLDWADSLRIPIAVVTNAPRENALLLLRGLGWAERFPTLVIGEELARGKPDPLPYQTGLRLLGADAANAVAFEDSLSGVRAAVAAGIETIGLMTGLDEERLRGAGASAVARDFADAGLLAIVRQRAAA